MVLRRKLNTNGFNNGDISAPLSVLKTSGFASPATLASGLRELLAVGLLSKTRESVGVQHGSRLCCLYAFTDLPCFDIPKLGITARPATHNWRQFKSVDEARAAIAAADAASKARGTKKKRTVRNSNCIDSKSELMGRFDDTNFVHPSSPSIRNLNCERRPQKQDQTPMDKGFQGVSTSDDQVFSTSTKFVHLSTCSHSPEANKPIRA